jgi:hypothetical protein
MLASSVEANTAAGQEVMQTQSGPVASSVEANTAAGQEVMQTQSGPVASSVEASAAAGQKVMQTQSGPVASSVEASAAAGQEVMQTQLGPKVNFLISVSAKFPRDLFFFHLSLLPCPACFVRIQVKTNQSSSKSKFRHKLLSLTARSMCNCFTG